MPNPAPSGPRNRPARERILLAAHELFYREGVRATGVDRVIAAAGVTKVTFYRHFPGKNDLVLAFLDHQHACWTSWFTGALQRHRPRHGEPLAALVPAIAEWLSDAGFRGCAFLNTVGELGHALPEATAACRRHKQAMATIVAGLLPASRQRLRHARAIAAAIDGAVMHAQFEPDAKAALQALRDLLRPFLAGPAHGRMSPRVQRPRDGGSGRATAATSSTVATRVPSQR